MSLLEFQVQNTGRYSAEVYIPTLSKLTDKKHILSFTTGISLQDISPAIIIVQVGENQAGLSHMLNTAYGLLFQHNNALIHIKCPK